MHQFSGSYAAVLIYILSASLRCLEANTYMYSNVLFHYKILDLLIQYRHTYDC